MVAVVISKPSTSTIKTNPSSGSKLSSKSSSSSQKNKSGGTYKNGGGGSSSWAYDYISDDGSSDYEPPPPPDPRQYYWPIIKGPYAVSNSRYYYTHDDLTKKKTIKEEITSGNSNSRIINTVTSLLSESTCAFLANNVPTQGPLGEISKAAYGRLAHKAIAEDVKNMIAETQTTKVYTNSASLNTIVSKTNNRETKIIGGTIRPDISIITKNNHSSNGGAFANVYEIKPSTKEGTGKGDAQLQKYVNTFNSYSNISAQKGGYTELDTKLGIQKTHTITYEGVEVSYHYSGDGMIYYDAPWDNKAKEPVPILSTEKQKEENTEVNKELIIAGTLVLTAIAFGILAPEALPAVAKFTADALLPLASLAFAG